VLLPSSRFPLAGGNPFHHSKPRVGAVGHVLLLPRLGIVDQEDAGRAIGKEDGNRVVVGLGEELAGRRGLRDSYRSKVSVTGASSGATSTSRSPGSSPTEGSRSRTLTSPPTPHMPSAFVFAHPRMG
jgi:hypothetical protein